MTTDTAHAMLSPSSAHIWRVCTGMPRMLTQVRDPLPRDDEASREGTAAHWAAHEMIEGRTVGEGQITPDGTVLVESMIQSAEVFAGLIQRRHAAATVRPVPGMNVGIESRLNGYSAHRFGTPDHWLYDANAGTLYVDDFKHGFGIVEVFECWQLIDYAGMLAQQLKLADTVRVVLTIVQPRAPHRQGPIREWRTTVGALRSYWHALDMAAEEATSPTPQIRPNPGCVHCEARHECPALQQDGYRSAQISQEAEAVQLSPAALGVELAHLTDAAERLKARISGLQAHAESLLRSGERVPNWRMSPGQSNLAWTVPVEQVVALGKALDVDLRKPLDVVTPTQAKQKLKGPAAAVVDTMAARPPAGMKLTRDDGAEMRHIFSQSGA